MGATTTGPLSWKDRIHLSIQNDFRGRNTVAEPKLAEYDNLIYLLPSTRGSLAALLVDLIVLIYFQSDSFFLECWPFMLPFWEMFSAFKNFNT